MAYIFVSPNGDNSGNGGIMSPYDVNTGLLNAKAGDTLLLRGGNYNPIRIKKILGQPNNHITLTRYRDEPVLITDPTVDNESDNPLIKIDRSEYITIRNLELANGSHGIHTSTGNHLIIDNNKLSNIFRRGIGGTSSNTIITNNILNRICINWENTNATGGWPGAIQAWESPDNWIVNNNIVANSWGEAILASANNILVTNNLIYNSLTVGIYVNYTVGGTFKNNVILQDELAPIKPHDNRKTHGFSIANEGANYVDMKEIEISENVIIGCEAGIRGWWEQSASVNAYIHHNVFMDCVQALRIDAPHNDATTKYFVAHNKLSNTPLALKPVIQDVTLFNNSEVNIPSLPTGIFSQQDVTKYVNTFLTK